MQMALNSGQEEPASMNQDDGFDPFFPLITRCNVVLRGRGGPLCSHVELQLSLQGSQLLITRNRTNTHTRKGAGPFIL